MKISSLESAQLQLQFELSARCFERCNVKLYGGARIWEMAGGDSVLKSGGVA